MRLPPLRPWASTAGSASATTSRKTRANPAAITARGCRVSQCIECSLLPVFECEAHLDRHLPMGNPAVFDVAPRVDDLEPAEMPHRLRGSGNRGPNGIV